MNFFGTTKVLILYWMILIIISGANSIFAQDMISDEDINPKTNLTDNVKVKDDLADDLDSLLNEVDQGKLNTLSNVKVSAAPDFNTIVTSVNRQATTVGKTSAAVFVITNEMIRKSGSRTIQDALRLAPGVHVAQINSNQWAISIRGDNGRFANKLLVQIDGRSIYNPIFSGVYWNMQDVLLEDVDRIEVVRGPGGTVWGANAVNGVINIITKKSSQTQGLFYESAGGDFRSFHSVRYGGKIDDDWSYRIYSKWHETKNGYRTDNLNHENFDLFQSGFRMDYEPDDSELFTFQGDFYTGGSQNEIFFPAAAPVYTNLVELDEHNIGGNVLSRYTRNYNDTDSWTIQAYFDTFDKKTNAKIDVLVNTWDVDFQNNIKRGDHSIIWGWGYRYYSDEFTNRAFSTQLFPDSRRYDVLSGFVQDEMTLIDDRLFFTLGTKVLHNDFTDIEWQPSTRLLWTPAEEIAFWGAISRSVMLPNRFTQNGRVTINPQPTGLPFPAPSMIYPVLFAYENVRSEVMISYEAGFRHQPVEDYSYDVSAFLYDYDATQKEFQAAPQFGPEGFILPALFGGRGKQQMTGFEIANNANMTDWWRLRASYGFMYRTVELKRLNSHEDPRSVVILNNSFTVGKKTDLDVIGRYVSGMPGFGIKSYTTMDVRLAYRPTKNAELFITGRNLLDPSHPEYPQDIYTGVISSEVRREVYAGASIRY